MKMQAILGLAAAFAAAEEDKAAKATPVPLSNAFGGKPTPDRYLPAFQQRISKPSSSQNRREAG
jgi:hypothetical protein